MKKKMQSDEVEFYCGETYMWNACSGEISNLYVLIKTGKMGHLSILSYFWASLLLRSAVSDFNSPSFQLSAPLRGQDQWNLIGLSDPIPWAAVRPPPQLLPARHQQRLHLDRAKRWGCYMSYANPFGTFMSDSCLNFNIKTSSNGRNLHVDDYPAFMPISSIFIHSWDPVISDYSFSVFFQQHYYLHQRKTFTQGTVLFPKSPRWSWHLATAHFILWSVAISCKLLLGLLRSRSVSTAQCNLPCNFTLVESFWSSLKAMITVIVSCFLRRQWFPSPARKILYFGP